MRPSLLPVSSIIHSLKQTNRLLRTLVAIYNTEHDGSWVVDHDTCLKAMQAPLGDHALTPSSEKLAKRDNCYGSGHNDYEGGYYKIDGIGAFGSEMYPSD